MNMQIFRVNLASGQDRWWIILMEVWRTVRSSDFFILLSSTFLAWRLHSKLSYKESVIDTSCEQLILHIIYYHFSPASVWNSFSWVLGWHKNWFCWKVRLIVTNTSTLVWCLRLGARMHLSLIWLLVEFCPAVVQTFKEPHFLKIIMCCHSSNI